MPRPLPTLLATCLLAATLPSGAAEPDLDRARDDRIAELERQLQVVVGELENLRAQSAVPETEAELTARNGYGPAASKVYSLGRGISLGGYAEGAYTRVTEDASGDSSD